MNQRAVLNVSSIFPGVLNNCAFKHCVCSQHVGGRHNIRPSQLLPRGLACGRQRCELSRKDPTLSVVTKPHAGSTASRRRALPFTTGGVRCPGVVRKHPHVKALTKQPTWKVKHFRSSNHRSSSPETAAAQVPSVRSRAAWSLPSPLSLNRACLVLRCYQVWVPLLGAGSKAPHDGVRVAWEVKGLRKSKARFSVLGATHISHAWAGWWRGQGEAASSVQTNN